MLDYADPCSLGPLNCNMGFRADSDVESMSVYSGVSRKSTGTHLAETNPINVLKNRVTQFQNRGWLSQQEHRKYMALLNTAPAAKENGPNVTEHVILELEKELNTLEDRMIGTTSQKKQSKPLSTPMAERPRAFNVFPQPCGNVPLSALSNKTNKKVPTGSIVEPKELGGELSDDQISELFVETCFFARLGFVQPPCCLQCTYRESMKSSAPNKKCGRWVIWRRDANHILHPHELCSNAIAVRCHTARKLLGGKIVESYKWDKHRKILLEPRTMKPFQPGKCI